MLSLPGYRIGARIYESAEALVFEGAREADGAPVVVKMLGDPHPRPSRVARLRREHALLTELRAAGVDGVPEPLALLAHGHSPALVLAACGGEALRELFPRRRFPLAARLRMAKRLAEVIETVHRAGVVHKDISPGNVVWNPETGAVQLIDLGLSTRLRAEAAEPVDARVIRGTLAYMAPEQTGRMNRDIDYRADLYALGATLCFVLTGRPPFLAADPLDLLHCHVAMDPPRLDERDGLPPVLAELVARLLAKTPEERYQSAAAVAIDLSGCLERLDDTEHITAFPLGAGDVRARFLIPQRLYGRDEEVAALLAAFDRAAGGGRELLLVAGYSGIGKTRLVKEVLRPMSGRRGLLGAGKFDQYRRGEPYSALIGAFGELIRHVLTLPPGEVERWRARLASAVGPNGAVVTEVIGETELVLGPQPPLPALSPAEARNRFLLTFERFARAFGDQRHPLVLFLDDLQWADPPSLVLLQRILVDPAAGHILVIGAYRDNEVDELHPLSVAIEELREDGAALQRIALGPLQARQVAELLSEALDTDAEAVAGLAAACADKAEGNPFFLTRLLLELHEGGRIHFDTGRRAWSWDVDAVRSMKIDEGAVELVLGRLQTLPARTRHLMRLAACIGGRFDLETLSVVARRDPEGVARGLWPALELGLVVPLGQSWTLLEHGEPLDEPVRYRFLHDRVQQAAYALIPRDERPDVHLEVGRLLQQSLPPAEREERLFEIVAHLQAATTRLDAAGRCELAGLVRDAGHRARRSAAYAPALGFYRSGLDLLGRAGWIEQPSLTLDLVAGAASASYSAGDFDAMDAYIDELLARAPELSDRIRAHEIRLSGRVAQNRPAEAIDIALQVLALVDVRLPRHPGPGQLAEWLSKASQAMTTRGADVGGLAELPEMTAAEPRAAMRILGAIASSTYVAAPDLFPLVCLEQIALSATHGVSPHSAFALTTFGILQGGVLGDADAADACARSALRLLQRFAGHGGDEIDGRTRYVAAAYLHHWKHHARGIWEQCPAIYQRCLDTGDLEFAAWAAMMRVIHGFFLGLPLGEAEPDAARWVGAIRTLGQRTALGHALVSWQAMRKLAGIDPDPGVLDGPVHDEAAMRAQHARSGDVSVVSDLELHRLILFVLAERWAEAREAGDKVAATVHSLVALFHVPLFHQYDALASLALGDLARADAAIEKLARLAENAPENHAHRHALLAGARAAAAGDPETALDALERAAALAAAHGWLLDLGLAHERAASLCAERCRPVAALAHAVEGRYAFERLGARVLVRRLEQRFPEAGRARSTGLAATRTGSSSYTTSSERLDFRSLLEASQAISGELQSAALCQRLVSVLLSAGGAQRVALVLGPDAPRVEARASTDGAPAASTLPLAEADDLPVGLLLYVLRSARDVVLADAAAEGRFADDPYVRRVRPRSVLCAPIVRQGRTLGAMYLENNLVAGAFTHDRIETLQVLAAQAAISIANAALVENLEDKVAERTAQLERSSAFIRRTFGRYLSDEVVDGLLDGDAGLSLGGALRRVTIMMADLRGFTGLAQRLSPPQTVLAINTYLSAMTEVVIRYLGTIDEFLGDAMLVIFGAPVARSDDAERALACAVAMQREMESVNARLAAQGLPDVEMGIGLCTGEVVVGNIGSERRAKYGVVGPAVNHAARIESYTTGGQILVDRATRDAVSAELRIDDELSVDAKGLDAPLTVYQIGGIGPPHDIWLAEPALELEPLAKPAPARFALQLGKHGTGGAQEAQLVALGVHGAELLCSAPLALRQDLRVWLPDTTEPRYAKVLETRSGRVRIRFT